jgi:DNA-binding NtrC family response regulator
MSGPAKLLIVEDEKLIRWSLRNALEGEGFSVVEAATLAEGRRALEQEDPDAVVCDVRLPDGSGLDCLKLSATTYPDIPFLMVTAYGSVEDAVAAMKSGAYDYLTKPVEPQVLLPLLRRALERTDLRREVRRLRAQQELLFGASTTIIGRSAAIHGLLRTIEKIGRSDAATILLSGESGTGKGLVARAIHEQSRRHGEPFMHVVCAAIPATLLESELFGYEKGAFTDARAQKRGLVELAEGGTLFLDEISEIPLGLQAKLLGFLEERTFKRVGGTRDVRVNIRVIAASNRNLDREVREGRFREDLYFRLKVIPLELPPLREHREDIPLLVEHFLQQFRKELGGEPSTVTPAAIAILQTYGWPGNVRELRNVLERSLLLGSDYTIDVADLPPDLRPLLETEADGRRLLRLPAEGLDFESLERDLVVQALEYAGGNQTRAGQYLGMNRDQIRYRVKKFGLGEPEASATPGVDR